MAGSGKRARSREAFTAVFEDQTRRFSPFELLGIKSDTTSPPTLPPSPDPSLKDDLSPQVEPIPPGITLEQGPDRDIYALVPDHKAEEQRPDQSPSSLKVLKSSDTLDSQDRHDAPRIDRHTQPLGPDRQANDQTVDPQQDQTLDGLVSGQTVWPSLGQTKASATAAKQNPLGPDRHPYQPSHESVLLAPLQWEVWRVLQEADKANRLLSYRIIAKETNSTIDGVRKAVRVLEKERLILQKDIIRTAEEQGFRVSVEANVSVRKGTVNETKAILKRGLFYGQTPDRQGVMLGPGGLRLFVCRNTNIKHTDIASLLRLPPPEWKIREQTLIQIADAHPDMTAIEFRLSLAHLIEQEKQAKESIRNPNAWVKAAFEKNGGPLVTEREIEARFERTSPIVKRQEPQEKGQGSTEEIELLRWYLTCEPEGRAEIDRSADAKAAPILAVVAEDKRASVLEAARLEAIRERVAKVK